MLLSKTSNIVIVSLEVSVHSVYLVWRQRTSLFNEEFFTWVIVQEDWMLTSASIDFIRKLLSRDDIKKKENDLGRWSGVKPADLCVGARTKWWFCPLRISIHWAIHVDRARQCQGNKQNILFTDMSCIPFTIHGLLWI